MTTSSGSPPCAGPASRGRSGPSKHTALAGWSGGSSPGSAGAASPPAGREERSPRSGETAKRRSSQA
eukprot:8716157-Alexandrium_andersonii.AAC.1